MKTKHILALLFLAIIPCSLTAQSLIPKTEAQLIAERLDQSQSELINHTESQLRAFHSAVNTEGKQQEILDALGANAAAAVQRYVMMRELILQLKPTANIPAPDSKVFLPQADGRVKYVAPPEPEKSALPTSPTSPAP